MKKIILSALLIGFTACIFAQSDEDNSANVPKVEVAKKNQSVDNQVSNYVEPAKDTLYCCRQIISTADTVQLKYVELSRPKAEIIVPEPKQLNSQEFYRQEQQKQLEQTRSLYNYGGNYYADKAMRYGFQVITQTIFPF
jgi:hypothetical protein